MNSTPNAFSVELLMSNCRHLCICVSSRDVAVMPNLMLRISLHFTHITYPNCSKLRHNPPPLRMTDYTAKNDEVWNNFLPMSAVTGTDDSCFGYTLIETSLIELSVSSTGLMMMRNIRKIPRKIFRAKIQAENCIDLIRVKDVAKFILRSSHYLIWTKGLFIKFF